MRTLYFFYTILVILFFNRVSLADTSLQNSVLIPPPNESSLYSQNFGKLSDTQRWKVRRHGLRYAPLDPLVWSTLRADKTQNRTLVPIRAYYLRVSEDENFKLKSIEANFSFKPVTKRHMLKMRHQKDPVFEIGLGGIFIPEPFNHEGKTSHGYTFRLSAFPPVASGVYFRSGNQFKLIQEAVPRNIEAGLDYQVLITASSESVVLELNAKRFLEISDQDLRTGLISLQTSWHPIRLSKLKITGDLNRVSWTGSGFMLTDSGKGLVNAQ
ncbi:MAG: hypothetical protein R3A13_11850 [Bdellovibrionota bacterium]